MTLQVESPCVYTSQGVPISVTGIAQVKVQGQNEDMLLTACEQFLGKSEAEINHIALVTLEGHQRAIMGSMTVEEIYKDRKKFSKQVFEVASSDLANMGITVVSYTIKDLRDEEVSFSKDLGDGCIRFHSLGMRLRYNINVGRVFRFNFWVTEIYIFIIFACVYISTHGLTNQGDSKVRIELFLLVESL